MKMCFNSISIIAKKEIKKVFKKLVANLPFSPGMIHQIGFYADRIRQEKSIRRLSFIFMALAMAVQSLAVISPPEKSLAASSTNLMNGLQTKTDILAYYDNPATNVKAIFNHYNLTREDIAGLSNTPDTSIFTNDGNNWWTVGTYSLDLRTDVARVYKDNERTVQYSPGKYVYERQWRAFDIINRNGQYRKAWKGVSKATGQTFWIVQSCGNITWIDTWKTPPPPTPTPQPEPDPEPELDIKKTVDKSGNLKPGDTFTYRIEYRNSKIGSSAATNTKITDQIDVKHLDLVSPKSLNMAANGHFTYEVGSLKYSNEYKVLEVSVRVKDPIANGTEVCNDGASIQATNALKKTSKKVCRTVLVPCPYDSSINTNNKNCIEPKLDCELLDIGLNLAKREATFKTVVSSSNDKLITVNSYEYDFGDGQKQTVVSGDFTNQVTHAYGPGEFDAYVVVNFTAPTESGQTAQKADCAQSVEFEEENPLGQHKTVENLTQGLKGKDATDTRVHAGDVLEYRLQTLNSNNYERTGVVISDYIGDLLDYASLDLEALEADGGRYDEKDKKVLWENVTIPANSKLETRFKITMLNPIPATNRPNDQGSDFDCVITNIYGDEISLDVACPAVKGIETIPNTGPGTSLMLAGGATFVIGYFFARARLFNKELDIIRTDYATTGGM